MKSSSVRYTTIFLAGLVIVCVVSYLFLIRVDKYLKFKAIDDCGKASRYQKTDQPNDAVIYYPVPDLYKECISRVEDSFGK